MDIQLNDIALFVEVAKRKNFSHAAEALNIPTSTLSRRVSELEAASACGCSTAARARST